MVSTLASGAQVLGPKLWKFDPRSWGGKVSESKPAFPSASCRDDTK